MSEKNCEVCEYWHDLKNEPAGECRRYAPHAKRSMEAHRAVAAWPITHPNDWCGDFSPKRDRVEGAID